MRLFFGCLLAITACIGNTQMLNASGGPPTQAFVGESFCYVETLTNPGPGTGFGPYFRITLPPGLTFDSASLEPSLPTVIDQQTFPALPGNQLTDPVIGDTVTGPENATFVSITLPVGSLVANGPSLALEICVSIDPGAIIGAPLDIDSQAAFVFGNTPEGRAPDDSIVGMVATEPVTPTIATFVGKDNTAPESERPPGQPFDYEIILDIANGVTLDDVFVEDILPPEILLTGAPVVTGGTGCVTLPNSGFPVAGATVSVDCASVAGGTSTSDLLVVLPVEVDDVLDEMVCDQQSLSNTATFNAEFAGQPLPSDSSTDSLQTEHLSLQKRASTTTAVPGNIVSYTLDIQVSEFATINGGAGNLTITDIVPDGLDVDEASFFLDGGTALSAVTSVVENTDGTTTITIDLGSALAMGLSPDSTAVVTYAADVLEVYRTTAAMDPLFGQPVRGFDSLTNTVSVLYGTSVGAANCNDQSSSTVAIAGYDLDKILLNPQPSYNVGDRVEFRLTGEIPSGELSDVVWTDFLPLPVTSALEYGATPSVSLVPTGACDIELGPLSDNAFGAPTVTAAGGTALNPEAPNTLIIDWGDIATDPARSVTLQIDLCFTLLGERFSDGLSLTNLATGSADGNTVSDEAETAADLFVPNAPQLNIEKSVVSVTNGNASVDGDGNASDVDAGDGVDYRITVMNAGAGRAFDVLVSDSVPAELTSCTVDSVTYGDGSTSITTTGDLFGAGLLLPNTNPNTVDGAIAPSGGGGVEMSDTVLIDVRCDVAPDVVPASTITNTAMISSYASGANGPSYPSEEDEAVITVAPMTIDKTVVSGSISPSEAAQGLGSDSNTNDEWTIGATAQYRVLVTLPEGEQNNIILRDTADTGLAIVSCESVTLSNVSVTPSAALALDASCSNFGVATNSNPRITNAGGAANQTARRALFDLGTVSVAQSTGSTPGTIEILYTVLLLDSTNNTDGSQRNNDAEWRRSNTVVVEDSAPNVRNRLPNMTVSKVFTPQNGQAGDITTLSITVAANGGANNPNAFDVLLEDIIDIDFQVTGPVTVGACGDAPDAGPAFDLPSRTVSATWDQFNKGSSCTIEVPLSVVAGALIGTDIPNTATLSYSNLVGGDATTELGDLAGTLVADPLDSERTLTASGSATYMVAPVMIMKTVVDRSETAGATQFDSSFDDATIGEVVTFEILATIPDGQGDNVQIIEQPLLLPYTLEILGISGPIAVGADLTLQGGGAIAPIVTIDDTNSDMINDELVIALGDIQNAVGGSPADNQVRFEVRARLLDRVENAAGPAELRNTVTVTSDTFPDILGGASINIVEPDLLVSKSGSDASATATDTIRFTIDVGHTTTSTSDARSVSVVDTLPPEFDAPTAFMFDGATPGFSCTVMPDTQVVGASTVTVTFDEIPVDDRCRFSYEATINASATLGDTVQNSVVLSYATTDAAQVNEQARSYTGQTAFAITLSEPGLTKTVLGTDNSDTPDSDGAFGMEADATIGENVTYRIVLEVPPGTIENAQIVDQLPWPGGSPSAILELVSTTVSSIGPDISTTSGAMVNDGPDQLTDSVPTDSVVDGFSYTLGNVVNSGVSTQTITFDVVARVVNDPLNDNVDNARNEARLLFDVAGVPQTPLGASADVDVVRPNLEIIKTPDAAADLNGGDTLTFTIEIRHSGDSTAPAYDLVVADTLPDPGTSNATNFSFSAACEGGVGSAPTPKTVSITIDRIALGATCSVSYDVTVDAGVSSGATYINEAIATFDTTPAGSGDTLGPIADGGSFAIDRPDISKSVFSTANSDIGTTQGDPVSPDAAIGDLVCYHSTITFPEGITEQATFTDEMPAGAANLQQGVIELTSAQVFAAGSLTASNGFASLTINDVLGGDGLNDTVTFDFGDITNATLDGVVTAADQLVVQVCGVIVNVEPPGATGDDANTSGDVLRNQASFSFFNAGSMMTDTQSTTTDIDVVEPVLLVSKAVGDVDDHSVTIQIGVTNTGNAPAYELQIDDLLSEADFDLSTITAVTTPAGFDFSSTPGVGSSLVSLVANPAALPPSAAVLDVGETISFSFSVDLATPIPDLTQPITNTADASATTMPGANPDERLIAGTTTVGLELPLLDLTKTDAVLVDADSSSSASGGDTLRYTLEVTNSGAGVANGLQLSDGLTDTNLSLVVGSVTTTQGMVLVGNTSGDSGVVVNIATLASGGTATVTFDATVATPLPVGVTSVSNQAELLSDEQPNIDSDDPVTPGIDDPTITPLSRQADLSIVKTFLPLTGVPGTPQTFILLVTNNGPDLANDVIVTDVLPPSLVNPSFTCNASAGANCTANGAIATGGTLMDGPLTMPPGSTVEYSIGGVLDPSVTAAVTNSVTVDTVTTQDPEPGNDSDTVTVPVRPVADLAVNKETTSLSLSDGDTVIYTLTVDNFGPSVAAGVVLNDPIPVGTSVSSISAPCTAGFPCALGDMAPGAQLVVTLELVLDDPYNGPASVFNQASVSSNTPDSNPDNNADSTTTPVGVNPLADVSLTKSGPTTAAVGSTVTFFLVATNDGPNDAQSVLIEDPVPPGLTYVGGSPACAESLATVTCSVGTLSVGASSSVQLTFTIPSAYSGPDPVVNTATVSTTTTDPNSTNDDATASVPLGGDSADLVLTKAGPKTVTPGDTVSYTLTAINLGPADATGVLITDPIPAQLIYEDAQSDSACDQVGPDVQCAIGGLTSGSSTTLTVTFTVPSGYSGPDPIVNTAVVVANEPDGDPANNSGVAFVSTGPLATVDLAVDKSGPSTTPPDNRVAFNVLVSNLSGSAAQNVVVTDPVPPQLSFVAASSDSRCALVVMDVVCAIPGLAGGSSTNLLLTFDVPLSYTGPDPIVNTASVSADNPDSNSTNDTDTHNVEPPRPSAQADKSGTLTADADMSGDVSPGDTITYTVAVRNEGDAAMTNVLFDDMPDSNTVLVAGSVTSSQGTVTQGNTVGDAAIAVSLGQIDGQSGATITYAVTVIPVLPTGVTQLVNQGIVRSDQTANEPTDDPATGPDNDPTVLPVSGIPVIEVTKVDVVVLDFGSDGPSPGDTLEYTIEIRNSGSASATNVALTDTPDPNTSLVVGSVTSTQGVVVTGNTAGDTSVAADIGTIPGGGGSVTLTFQVDVALPLPSGVTQVANQAVVSSDGIPPVLSDDPDTPPDGDETVTPLIAQPLLDAFKTAQLVNDADNDTQPSPGDTLRYSIVVSNIGNQDAAGVQLADTPDSNTTLVVGSVSATQGTVVIGNVAGDTSVEVNLGTISGSNASATVTYDVTINSPLPAGVTQIVNQGSVSAPGLPTIPTDDPDTPSVDDPTLVPVTATPILDASKGDSLWLDNDGDMVPSPGDELLYLITITNSGNGEATGVVFSDIPGDNTTLIVGSVATTLGAVMSGNSGGDTTVEVNVGSIAGQGGQVDIGFRVTIDNPVPAGVFEVVNQGTVTSDQLPVLPTDDPELPGGADPTPTPINASPILEAVKTDTLTLDADMDGIADPGDTLTYTLVITNRGNAAATSVILDDLPDGNTSLIAGSVASAPTGTVIVGNSAGDTSVTVDIGTLPGGGATTTVTFDVVVDNPLAQGVTVLSNQGLIGSDQLPTVPTDDPDASGTTDPTLTPVGGTPVLAVSKVALLSVDVNMDGFVGPGDTLTYIITITNSGDQGANSVFANDVLDPNVSLVIGSVATSRGNVTQGNTAGDANVGVEIGIVPGGGEDATISFDVVINDPLPAGVTQVSNQATVTSDELPPVESDDPGPPGDTDPTITPVTTDPALDVLKSGALLVDADMDGVASPGDTLLYVIDVINTGNVALTAVEVMDVPDTNVTLIAGSVQTTQGVVINGNSPGDTSVFVSIGTVAGRTTQTVSFEATINLPLADGVTAIINQARVDSDQLPPVLSDDPATPGVDDPVIVPVETSPSLQLSKRYILTNDADMNGLPSPGDTLTYLVDILNDGNVAVTGIVVADTPDPNTTLVAGSVQTSLGSVVEGNTPGDVRVEVNIGPMAGQSAQIISFDVLINSPLGAGVSTISNQAVATSDQLPPVESDDPTTPGGPDPTLTPVTTDPSLDVVKQDVLAVDTNMDGFVGPGDVLTYLITITNTGNVAVTGVAIDDTPDVNTMLLVGSVQTSQGSVVTGNSAGDTAVSIAVDTIPGGAVVTSSFDVVINSPLPAGVTTVANQATVSSDSLPPIESDDPGTPPIDDETVTPVTTMPSLTVLKTAILSNDADLDSLVSAGDTVTYLIDITNDGNIAVSGITLSDTPDMNTVLVAGSVQVTQGVVVRGNSPGDADVLVTVGTLPGNATQTVSFDVLIPEDLPSEVSQIVNQAVASSDQLPPIDSDDPTVPGNTDPTVLPVVESGEAVLTVRKRVRANVPTSAGQRSIVYEIDVANSGTRTLLNLQIEDDLGMTFPTPLAFTVLAVTSPSGLTLNSGFDGSTDTLLLSGTDSLGAGTSAVVTIEVAVDFGAVTGVFNNTAIATGRSGVSAISGTSTAAVNVGSILAVPATDHWALVVLVLLLFYTTYRRGVRQ